MIYKKIQNGTDEELKEISFEEASLLARTEDLVFDSPLEELNFYKEVIKQSPSHNPARTKRKQTESRISSLLPFLEDEELHEIVLSIVNDEKNDIYKNLDLMELFPFINEEDAELLFVKGISDPNSKINPGELAPFVSEKALTIFVDEYLKGSYQDVDIDELYPFMKSSDIKRLFLYHLGKKKQETE